MCVCIYLYICATPRSGQEGTRETVKPRFVPWLEPFSVRESFNHFGLFPPRHMVDYDPVIQSRPTSPN